MDGHYSNVCLKAMKKFGIEHKSNTIHIMWDDKNKIKFGAPGEPLAQSHKTKRKFVLEDLKCLASDYNICMKSHAIPSLMGKIILDMDNSYALGKCCDMEVTMIIKDRAIYLLNAFQYAAELIMN